MKNYLFIFVAFSLCIFFCSCKKSSPNSNQSSQAFTWQVDGGAQKSATSIYYYHLLGFNIIDAGRDSTVVSLLIGSTNTGTYTNMAGSASVRLEIGSTQYTVGSCYITISSNSNNKLSGAYYGVFSNATGPFTLTGSFTGIAYY
ncbi:MAG: hypothetical protein ABIO79_04225 [Ferruginibacter sp.]